MKHLSLFDFFSKTFMAFSSVCVLATGCASNPTGGSDFVLVSEKREIELSTEARPKLLEENGGAYSNSKLEAYVNSVGQKLVQVSDRPDLSYSFTVLDNIELEAFTTGGGLIYISRWLIALLTSEAQLAAVLAHEIAHNTARHSVRAVTEQRVGKVVNTAISLASTVATGTNVIGDTSSYLTEALRAGHGRERELEADALAAKYLARAGYDPNAMIEALSIFKDYENLGKKILGIGTRTHHGVFASHPRTDVRLQQLVSIGAANRNSEAQAVDDSNFREATSDLLVSASLQKMGSRNRYYQKLLGYTVGLPPQWTFEETTTTMTASAPAGSTGTFKVETQRLQQNVEPRVFIRDNLGIANLQQAEALQQFGLVGYTGIKPNTQERVAVVYFNSRAFIMTSAAADEASQKALLDSIKSFRPIARNEGVFADPLKITWVQADGRRWADIAGNSPLQAQATAGGLPALGENLLRLMNGDYPTGEPKPGEWIKLVD